MRKALQESLTKKAPEKDWTFITRQIGMFSFTGLNPKQVCMRAGAGVWTWQLC